MTFQSRESDLVAKHKWFHAIDFGPFASSGRFKPGQPQNITLFGAFEFLSSLDLSASRVLDLGTYDGIVAFGAKASGARSVTAVDTHDQPTFRLARDILGYSATIDYCPNLQISSLHQAFSPKSFDVIVCAGIIYHMLFPMQAFTETRKLLADDGYLIMETPFDAGSDQPILTFNSEEFISEPLTYFVPTQSALVGMANLAGFQLIATRTLNSPKRITLLLKASTRDELIEDPNVAPYLKQMLKRDLCDDVFRFKELEKLPAAPARAFLKCPLESTRTIHAASEQVTWPHHFQGGKPALGSTRYETADGNLLKL